MGVLGVLSAVVGVVVGACSRPVLDGFVPESPIPRRWCESACAIGFAAVALRFGWTATLVPALAFVWWCFAVSVVDLRVRRLPNLLSVPGAAVVVGYAAMTGQLRAALVGGVMLAALYLVPHLVLPAAMGAGDVKLALGVGAAAGLAGAQPWLVAAALAPLLTAVAGLVRGRTNTAIAHGPSMCAATGLVLWPV
ncbi:prepilin peptidase [Rhodococcus sp. ABRD24]|nr:prepilin peptidase [Rhodococcus sp. ABRD24]